MMELSIVTTTYNSAETIEQFLKNSYDLMRKLGIKDFEIVVIDDGSDAEHVKETVKACRIFAEVKLELLTRNFGHHVALLRGLKLSKGNLVFLIDSDLEEEVHWFENFFNALKNSEIDVAYGVQESRRGNLYERVTGAIFYWTMSKFMGVKIPKNFMTARLMRRTYVDNLLKFNEFNVNLSGLMTITGHSQQAVQFNKNRLRKGDYTLKRKMNVFVDAVTSFSDVPLRFIFKIGLMVIALTIFESLVLVLLWVWKTKTPDGWLSLFLIVQLFGGLILASIGIVGIYLAKIFLEVKNRPRTLNFPIKDFDK
jgi:putative glycosyltransferase